MEIIVKGSAEGKFDPDEMIINISFSTKGKTYAEALELGTRDVELFINDVLLNSGFTKEELKTRRFSVYENQIYNSLSQKYEKDGFMFRQNAFLKFDYDKEKMANLIEKTSFLNNPPVCNVEYGIKNIKMCKRQMIAEAYKDAYEQAYAVAAAAGKELKTCQKVDFESFEHNYDDMSYAKMGDYAVRGSAAGSITNTFNPEEIKLSETLYCLWIAE